MAELRRRNKDVSTVISMLPFAIDERKPGLNPGRFQIAAAKENDFELLIIERCTHPVYLDEARPRLIVPDPSDLVADSVVMDLKQSIHGYVADVAEPGLSWVGGEFPNTKEGKDLLSATHSAMLKTMKILQDKWFEELVRVADDDWGRYQRHSFITPTQRRAALALGLKKEWLLEQEIKEAQSTCKFCFTMVHPLAIICPTCRGVLDEVRYAREFKEGTVERTPTAAVAK